MNGTLYASNSKREQNKKIKGSLRCSIRQELILLVGPIRTLMCSADARLLGELTPKMAQAVASCTATKGLLRGKDMYV